MNLKLFSTFLMLIALLLVGILSVGTMAVTVENCSVFVNATGDILLDPGYDSIVADNTNYCLRLTNPTNVLLDCQGVRIEPYIGGTYDAIQIEGDVNNLTVQNCWIGNNSDTFFGNGIDQYMLAGTDLGKLSIKNNSVFLNDGGYGIYVDSPSGYATQSLQPNISGNYVSVGEASVPFAAYTQDGAVITDNIFIGDSPFAGLVISSASTSNFANNFYVNKNYIGTQAESTAAIYLERNFGGTFDNITVFNNTINASVPLSIDEDPNVSVNNTVFDYNTYVNPSDTGYSQTCVDNNADYICDTPYNLFFSSFYDNNPISLNTTPLNATISLISPPHHGHVNKTIVNFIGNLIQYSGVNTSWSCVFKHLTNPPDIQVNVTANVTLNVSKNMAPFVGGNSWRYECNNSYYNVSITSSTFALRVDNVSCVENWTCSGYGACVNLTRNCTAVIDENTCGTNYTGNYSEFSPQICGGTTPSPSAIGLGILVFDLILFILISVLDGMMMRKSPETNRAFRALYGLIGLIAIVAVLSLLL